MEKNYCPFCNNNLTKDLLLETSDTYSIYDRYPVSLGHVLIIPKRHCSNYFELTIQEQISCLQMLNSIKEILMSKYNPDGYNIGININKAGGQTINHVHIHLIPRYNGDVDEPAGGVRGVIPSKRRYC